MAFNIKCMIAKYNNNNNSNNNNSNNNIRLK